MPAPYSRLKPERKPFAPVDTANKLYKKTLAICLKMPKRYTYLVLKEALHMASEVRRYAKGANSVFPTNAHEAQIRKDYWIHARAILQGLSGAIDDFLEIPAALNYKDGDKTKGITVHELEEIADLINEEMKLITNQIESESKRFKNL